MSETNKMKESLFDKLVKSTKDSIKATTLRMQEDAAIKKELAEIERKHYIAERIRQAERLGVEKAQIETEAKVEAIKTQNAPKVPGQNSNGTDTGALSDRLSKYLIGDQNTYAKPVIDTQHRTIYTRKPTKTKKSKKVRVRKTTRHYSEPTPKDDPYSYENQLNKIDKLLGGK